MPERPKRKELIVERGYDRIGIDYHRLRQKNVNWPPLEAFAKLLPEGARVLDLGCGGGIPVAKFLASRGCDVTGIDISSTMVKLARKNVPKAKFVKMDMTRLKFGANSFDGIIAVYSVFHVPKEKQGDLFKNLRKVLKPSGIMLVSLGTKEGDFENKFFGVGMFWSNFSPKQYRKLIMGLGFEIIFGKVIKTPAERLYWLLVRNGK